MLNTDYGYIVVYRYVYLFFFLVYAEIENHIANLPFQYAVRLPFPLSLITVRSSPLTRIMFRRPWNLPPQPPSRFPATKVRSFTRGGPYRGRNRRRWRRRFTFPTISKGRRVPAVRT